MVGRFLQLTVKKVMERMQNLKKLEEWLTKVHTDDDTECSFGKPNDNYFRPLALDLARYEYWRLQDLEVPGAEKPR